MFIPNMIMGQDSANSPLKLSAYADFYAGFDFSKPPSKNRPAFIYNFNRDREFNINLVFGKINYLRNRVRAALAIAAGTYMNKNYSAEPEWLQHLLEGNAGFKLSKHKNLWLDVGVLPSHIGFESTVGKDN